MLPKSCLRLLLSAAFILLSSDQSHAQHYSWSSPTGGSWTNGLNWGSPPGDYPNSAISRATFSSSVNGSPMTVTLDSAITLRRLIFNANQSGGVTIAPGTGGTLTFDDPETGQPSLNVITGSETIPPANVTIQGPLRTIGHRCESDTHNDGNIGGTQALTKLDTGTLLLNGTNTMPAQRR